jgi:hypothetical protein
VKVKVAERQFDAKFPNGREPYDLLKRDWTLSRRLEWLLFQIARAIGCDVKELRLDHDPPLGARPKHRRGLGKKTYYIPDANDPEHLFYRPHGPEHAGSHLIKTNIRGDHGQHPDRVLIKKARRLERGPKTKRPSSFSSPQMRSEKRTWPKRKLETRRKP